MTSNVLPLFWHLASSSRDTRLNASADLVSSLEGFQQNYLSNRPDAGPSSDDEDEEESGEEVDESDDEDDAEAEKLDKALAGSNAEDVVYTIRRLVRGLGSSRESSRLGFAVALTELLARITTITAPQVLSLLLRNSQYSNSMKGSEERDMLFARLFGLTAIIQSNILFASSSRPSDFSHVVDELLDLSQAKGWLRESAWWALVGLVEKLLDSKVEWIDEAVQAVVERVYDNEGWSSEKVGMTVMLERRRPGLDWRTLLAPTFRHTPLLSSPNLTTLGRILKESDSDDEETGGSTSTGSWKPQLHFVWNIIIDSFFPASSEASTSGVAPFQDFFRVVVDESLFSNTSSPERKYWGFSVFSLALPRIPSTLMPQLFTPNFMRCWMNNLSSPDRYLHKAAIGIAKQVQDVVKKNPKVGFTLLSTLVGKHGRPDFDKVTKTKTVESIMSGMDGEGAGEYVAYLQGIVLAGENPQSAGTAIEDRRHWALDQLLALCRNGSVPKTDAWVSSVLDFLLVHGFFVIRKTDKKSNIAALHTKPSPPLSEISAAACRSRFFSCLVEVTTAAVPSKDVTVQPNRQQGTDTTGQLWVAHILQTLSALQANKGHLELTSDADDEINEERKTATASITAIKNVKNADADLLRGAEILLSFVLLRTYDDDEDALDMLEEVDTAIQELFSLSSTKASTSGEGTPPIDTLLDVLIALLDKGSNDLRNLASLVVGLLASAFTSSSIEHLVAQLESSAGSAAVADLDEGDEESEEEDDQVSEDDEDELSGSEPEDVSDDDDPPVDPAFRQRVAEALQVSGLAVDVEGGEEGLEDESDDELWDDDQMLKIDEQLAEVFRQQAGSSKKGDIKNLQIESLHFKNRILDFFDMFARKQPANPLILEILAPLLRLVRESGSSEADLANKAAGILRSRIGKAKEIPSTLNVPSATKTLEEIHDLARKAISVEFSNLCSIASLFVSRALDASIPESTNISPAVESYRKTLEDFITRKNTHVQPSLILDYVRRYPARAWPLQEDLCKYISPKSDASVNAYRQTQAYLMLQALSTQLSTLIKAVGPDEVKAFITRASSNVYGTLEVAAKSDGTNWKADRLKDVLRFALQLARTSKSILPIEEMADLWSVQRLKEVEEAFGVGEKTKEMKGVQALLRQLVAVLEGTKAKEWKKEKGKKSADRTPVNGDGDGDVEMVDAEASVDKSAEAKVAKKEKKVAKAGKPNGSLEPTTANEPAKREAKVKKRPSLGDGTEKEKKKKVKTT